MKKTSFFACLVFFFVIGLSSINANQFGDESLKGKKWKSGDGWLVMESADVPVSVVNNGGAPFVLENPVGKVFEASVFVMMDQLNSVSGMVLLEGDEVRYRFELSKGFVELDANGERVVNEDEDELESVESGCRLYEIEEDAKKLLRSSRMTIKDKSWHKFSIKRHGSNVEIGLDGNRVFSFESTKDFNRIGLWARGVQEIKYESFKINRAEVIHSEFFSANKVYQQEKLKDWEIASGNWRRVWMRQAKGELLHQDEKKHSVLDLKKSVPLNFYSTVKLKILGTGMAGFKLSDIKSKKDYLVQLSTNNKRFVELIEINGGKTKVLKSVDAHIYLNHWHELGIRKDGNILKIYLDGIELIDRKIESEVLSKLSLFSEKSALNQFKEFLVYREKSIWSFPQVTHARPTDILGKDFERENGLVISSGTKMGRFQIQKLSDEKFTISANIQKSKQMKRMALWLRSPLYQFQFNLVEFKGKYHMIVLQREDKVKYKQFGPRDDMAAKYRDKENQKYLEVDRIELEKRWVEGHLPIKIESIKSSKSGSIAVALTIGSDQIYRSYALKAQAYEFQILLVGRAKIPQFNIHQGEGSIANDFNQDLNPRVLHGKLNVRGRSLSQLSLKTGGIMEYAPKMYENSVITCVLNLKKSQDGTLNFLVKNVIGETVGLFNLICMRDNKIKISDKSSAKFVSRELKLESEVCRLYFHKKKRSLTLRVNSQDLFIRNIGPSNFHRLLIKRIRGPFEFSNITLNHIPDRYYSFNHPGNFMRDSHQWDFSQEPQLMDLRLESPYFDYFMPLYLADRRKIRLHCREKLPAYFRMMMKVFYQNADSGSHDITFAGPGKARMLRFAPGKEGCEVSIIQEEEVINSGKTIKKNFILTYDHSPSRSVIYIDGNKLMDAKIKGSELSHNLMTMTTRGQQGQEVYFNHLAFFLGSTSKR